MNSTYLLAIIAINRKLWIAALRRWQRVLAFQCLLAISMPTRGLWKPFGGVMPLRPRVRLGPPPVI